VCGGLKRLVQHHLCVVSRAALSTGVFFGVANFIRSHATDPCSSGPGVVAVLCGGADGSIASSITDASLEHLFNQSSSRTNLHVAANLNPIALSLAGLSGENLTFGAAGVYVYMYVCIRMFLFCVRSRAEFCLQVGVHIGMPTKSAIRIDVCLYVGKSVCMHVCMSSCQHVRLHILIKTRMHVCDMCMHVYKL